MSRIFVLFTLGILPTLAGCSAKSAWDIPAASKQAVPASRGFQDSAERMAETTTGGQAFAPSTFDAREFDSSGETASNGRSEVLVRANNLTQQPDPSANRKIIYTATIEVVVTQFDGVPEKIAELVQSHGGYIAKTSLGQMTGEQRRGSWTARIPVDKYHEFLEAAGDLGVPESLVEAAHDVSEEFVDLEARLVSSRKLEEQILKLLEKQDDKIENVIAVERELSRVRLEIEQMEGRKRFLADQVAMSTVTITIQEERQFIPEQTPGLSTRLGSEWAGAQERLSLFGENLLLSIVANVFVIVAWIIGLVVALFVFRRLWRAVAKRLFASRAS